MCLLGVELMLSGLAANAFIQWSHFASFILCLHYDKLTQFKSIKKNPYDFARKLLVEGHIHFSML